MDLWVNEAMADFANACEFEGDLEGTPLYLFEMWAGAYRDTTAYVWARTYDEAFEVFVEWLDDNHPDQLYDLTEDDLREAAKDLGLAWDSSWPDPGDSDFDAVVERAEEDLTIIGHTTMKHGQYILAHEWGGSEIDDAAEYEKLARESMLQCYEHDFLVGDRVYYSGPDPWHIGPDETVEEYIGFYTVEQANDSQTIVIENEDMSLHVDIDKISAGEEEEEAAGGFVIRGT